MLLAETIQALANQNPSNRFFKNTSQWMYPEHLFIATATKSPIQMMSFLEEPPNKS